MALPCTSCYSQSLPPCNTSFTIHASLDADTVYYLKVIDKFGNAYIQQATTNGEGVLTADADQLPAGMLTTSSGTFTLQVSKNQIPFAAETFWLCDEAYTCIQVTIVNDDSLEPAINCYSENNPPLPPDVFCSRVDTCLAIDRDNGTASKFLNERGEMVEAGIDCDELAACAVIQNLQTDLTNETTARANADTTLTTNLNAHIANTANPHNVTKTQVGLSNVDNVQQIPLSYLDTDGTLAANSDTKVATQQAVKEYVDAHVPVYGFAAVSTKTTNHTAVLADGDGKTLIQMNLAGNNNFTVPPNSSVAFPVGSILYVEQMGAGQTTIAPGSGVTLNAPDGALKLRVQYSSAMVVKVATDTWRVWGDLSA